MNWQTISLRGLQAYCLISALIAVVGGGSFVVAGADGLALVVGAERPELAPLLQTAADAIDDRVRGIVDTWYRALGWYWLMTGLMVLWITPRIAERTDWFRFVGVAFMAVGVGNAVSMVQSGAGVHDSYVGLAFEFGIPLLAIVWQAAVARAQAALPTL